jgi:uncharacterized protein
MKLNEKNNELLSVGKSLTKQFTIEDRRLLFAYLLFTFSFTWGIALIILLFPSFIIEYFGKLTVYHPLYFAAVYAPSITASLLVYKFFGKENLKCFLKRLIKWNIGTKPYYFSLIFVLGGHFIVRLVETVLNLPHPDFGYKWYMFVPLAFMYLIIDAGPIGEELGWRGILLPLLQRKYNSVASSIILGIIWSVWHLPAFFISTTNQSGHSILIFFLVLISFNMLITQIFNMAKGSILITIMLHWFLNLSLYLNITGSSNISSIFTIAIFCLAAIYIKFRYNPKEHKSLFDPK